MCIGQVCAFIMPFSVTIYQLYPDLLVQFQNQQEDKYKATECSNSQWFQFAAQSNTLDFTSLS